MHIRRALLALAFALIAGPALAADCYPNAAGTQANCEAVAGWNNSSGQSQPVTLAAPLPVQGTVTASPAAGAVTTTSVTVTNASGAFLAASTATKFLLCKNESTTASIALNFANGTAVLNTAGNITLPPGASITFDGNQVPTGAITAISSAATSPATCLSS